MCYFILSLINILSAISYCFSHTCSTKFQSQIKSVVNLNSYAQAAESWWRKSHSKAVFEHYKSILWTPAHPGKPSVSIVAFYLQNSLLALLLLPPLIKWLSFLCLSGKKSPSDRKSPIILHPNLPLIHDHACCLWSASLLSQINQRSSPANDQSLYFASHLLLLPQSPGFINYLFSPWHLLSLLFIDSSGIKHSLLSPIFKCSFSTLSPKN